MTLEEQMQLVVDLQDRTERFITEVYDLTRKHTTGPREGVLLLVCLYRQ